MTVRRRFFLEARPAWLRRKRASFRKRRCTIVAALAILARCRVSQPRAKHCMCAAASTWVRVRVRVRGRVRVKVRARVGVRVRVAVKVALLHPASEAARECRAAQPAERAAHEAVRARAAEHHLTKARRKPCE